MKIQLLLFLFFLMTTFSTYGIELDAFLQYIPGMHTSFFAEVSFETTLEDGTVKKESADLYYKYPDKMHINWISSGKIIATNGRSVWLYNPESLICIKQTVEKDSTEGFIKVLMDYKINEVLDGETRTIRFIKFQETFYEVLIVLVKETLSEVVFKDKDTTEKIIFHSLKSDIEFKSSLFYYKPPFFVQVVENILN